MRGTVRAQFAQAGVAQALPELSGQIPALADAFDVVGHGGAARQALQRVEDVGQAGQLADRLAGRGRAVLAEVEDGAVALDAAGAGLQRAGDEAGEHAFAQAVAADDAGRRAVDEQVDFVEQRVAVGELKTELAQGGQAKQTRDMSHRHLRKMGDQTAGALGRGGVGFSGRLTGSRYSASWLR